MKGVVVQPDEKGEPSIKKEPWTAQLWAQTVFCPACKQLWIALPAKCIEIGVKNMALKLLLAKRMNNKDDGFKNH